MKKTFYVASSFTNRAQVRDVASYLRDQGLRWAFDHDWTVERVANLPDSGKALKAQMDLQAAVDADLFVILLASPLTPGCHGELGARASHNREVHLIRQGVTDWHLFHAHPCVIEHETIESFMRYTFGS